MAAIPTIPAVSPGQAVQARHYNALAQAVGAIAAALGPENRPALVRRVRLGVVKSCTSPAGTPALPSATRYTIDTVDDGGGLIDREPDWGRLLNGDAVKIYPHAPGTPCLVFDLVAPDGQITRKLMILPERLDVELCGA